MTTFNETEQEAITLNAVWGMINDMVNYEMFEKFTRTTVHTGIFRFAARPSSQ